MIKGAGYKWTSSIDHKITFPPPPARPTTPPPPNPTVSFISSIIKHRIKNKKQKVAFTST